MERSNSTSAFRVQRMIVQTALTTNNTIAPLGIEVARRGLRGIFGLFG